jgi:hypothetical protein
MFTSKQYIGNFKSIPTKWIFEKYLNLPEELEGQRIHLKSIFNKDEKTPSMFLYYSDKHKDYRFKCFSSGNYGDGFNLMSYIWGLDLKSTIEKISTDYVVDDNKCIQTDISTLSANKAKLKRYTIKKSWDISDFNYWNKYNISFDLLHQHYVYPLQDFTIEKNGQEYIICNDNMYGYFTKTGTLYKIYQPLTANKLFKFFLVDGEYIQGSDQCTQQNTLIIASSLKDIISLRSLGIIADIIAPNSENTILTPYYINMFKKRYDSIVVIFDSDVAGIKAAKKYEELYNIPFVYFSKAKDVSDLIELQGKTKTMYELVPKIHNAIEKYVFLRNEELELQKSRNKNNR